MKKTLKNLLLTSGLGIVGLVGCDNYDSLHEEEMKKRGHTQEEAEVLTAASYRRGLAKEAKNPDGTAEYVLHYKVLSNEDLLKVVEETHKDLVDLKENITNLGDLKYLRNTGFGEHILKQEKIFKYHRDMLCRKVLHNKFKEMAGEGDYSYHWYGYNNGDDLKKDERYSLATILPLNQEKLEFDADYVKNARGSGKLKDPAAVVEEVIEKKKFFTKVRNPNYPLTDRSSETALKEIKLGLKATSLNLDDDDDKNTDYIEIYRIKSNGKTESKPAIKVFKSRNGSGPLEVVVADKDLEGQPGFGMPDLVDEYPGITAGSDALKLEELTDYIFQDLKKPDLKMPDLKDLNKVYIVKTGVIPAEKYDIKKDGWESELPDYKSPHQNARVWAHIMLDTDDEEMDEEMRRGKIKWIAQEYPGGKRVVEFYRPNESFSKEEYQVQNIRGRIVSLIDSNGHIIQREVSAICEKKAFRIDFDRNQEKRWQIVDLDNNKKHYEAKLEVAWPWEVIPKE